LFSAYRLQYIKTCFLYSFALYFNYIVSFQSTISFNKLYNNDALVLIYLLSSKTHTIWVFFFIIYFIWLIYDKTHSLAAYAGIQIILLYSFYNIIEQSVVFSYVNTKVYNTTLQNGLLYIHPIIIYYAYAIVFYVWLWHYYLNKIHYFFKSRGPNLYINSIIVTAGILLGAWWAAQEFNW
jgi:hypothetical protein